MIENNDKPPNDNPAVSIEKALLADICLGLPLGRIALDLTEAPPPTTDVTAPNTYLFRGSQLAALKHAARGDHPLAREAVDALTAAADKALQLAPPSVTEKLRSRFSADAHDYQSLAKYYWPDPTRPNSLPWSRRDGDINPDCYSDDFDYLRLSSLADNLTVLAVAAYLTDNPKYGTHAAAMLQRWFIAPETRQNPHFGLAQVIPSGPDGPYEGRWAGLIEARFLIYVTEAVRLLESCGQLSPELSAGLRDWFGQLLDWMLESSAGQRALSANNNIALWQALQCMVYADFCDRHELAAACIRENVIPQIKRQLKTDGSLPNELKRAYPHDYIAFSVAAMALISRAGEHHGLSLWDQQTGDGRNFQAPHDWLLRATRASDLLALTNQTNSATPADKAQGTDLAHTLDTVLQLRTMARAIEALEHHEMRGLSQLKKLEIERDQTANDLAKLQKSHTELIRYALRTEQAIDRILDSPSWRLSRPLRILANHIRRSQSGEKRRDFLPKRAAALTQEAPSPLKTNEIEGRAESGFLTLLRKAKSFLINANQPTPDQYLEKLSTIRPKREEQLRATYTTILLSRQPETFVLYRIIGNDLHPRHRIGQSRENLRFVLENEPPLTGCEKRWVVNRIVNSDEEHQIIELLTAHGQEYIHIPFVADDYRRIGWDFDALPSPDFLVSKAFRKLTPEEQDRARVAVYRLKNLYVMNNNGARNAALRDGRSRAKWVLPWDGNCFITSSAWRDIVADVTARPHLKYFAAPMERILDNADLLRDDYRPNPVEEPQLLFRCDAAEEFNEAFPYGRRPKVELFWRLGIPGIWDAWRDDRWDPPRRPASPEAGQFGCAGWVARMFSGQQEQEGPHQSGRKNRVLARRNAILSAIDAIDQQISPPTDVTHQSVADTPSPTALFPICANRNDGLGERLNAIFNAKLISEITGAPFRFSWPSIDSPRFADFHAVAPAEDVFSEDFLRAFLVPDSETEGLRGIGLTRGTLDALHTNLSEELTDGARTCPQNPGLTSLLDGPKDALEALTKKVLQRITFSAAIERVRRATLIQTSFPENAVAIHIRAGDIIYGRYADNPRWTGKLICAPMAALLAQELQKQGKQVVLFGQEQATSGAIAKRFGCHTADTFYPKDISDDLEFAFADIFLMSRCTEIFSGSSGFARMGAQIGLVPLRSPFSDLKQNEWPDYLDAEVSAHPELYSREQRAYAYLICFEIALKRGDREPLVALMRLARKHNPDNCMYQLLEAFGALHQEEHQQAEVLLRAYFHNCGLESGRSFIRSPQVRALRATDSSAIGLAYSRFLPPGLSHDDRHPHLAATLKFLQRHPSTESTETLRNDLVAARTVAQA